MDSKRERMIVSESDSKNELINLNLQSYLITFILHLKSKIKLKIKTFYLLISGALFSTLITVDLF